MEKAIEKAIEGGYTAQHYSQFIHLSGCRFALGEHVLLDSTFWQCLGKSLGWKKLSCKNCGVYPTMALKRKLKVCVACCRDLQTVETWQYEMHRFVDHIIEGKDVDEFFNNLLSQ